MITISKAIHHHNTIILLKFNSNLTLVKNSISFLNESKYSKTYGSWYIPYTKKSWAEFLNLKLPYTIETFGTASNAEARCDNTDTNITEVPRPICAEAADTKNISIKYMSPFLFVKGKLSLNEIGKLKKIEKAYWNPRYENWVIPASIESLQILKTDLRLLDQNQFEIWSKQIILISNPPTCTIYTSPQYPGQVAVQLSGEGVDVDFLNLHYALDLCYEG